MMRSIWMIGCAAMALVPGVARATDADDADSEARAIIVTGTRGSDPQFATGSKTGTDPRDVPAAIAIIPDTVLRDQDVRTLDLALTNASAVAPSFGGGYGLADNYVVRGLPLRFLRDGLPDGNTFNGYRRTLADVASIEVLKGPGSALYGRAEAGGSVNLTTRAPDDAFALVAQASYGRFDTWAVSGDITGPIVSGVAAHLIGNVERTGGYRGLARRQADILPTIRVDLGAHRLTFDYDYRDQSTVIDNYGQPFTTAGVLAAVSPDARFYSSFNRADQRIDRFTVRDDFAATDTLQLRAALIYDRRALSFARNAGGNAINAAGVMTGRGGRTQRDAAAYWTGQAEAVWSPHTGAVQHTILLGAEYASADIGTLRRTYTLPNITITGGTATAPETGAVLNTSILSFSRTITSDTLSVYGQEELAFGDLFRIRAGARLDSVKLVDAGLFNGTATAITAARIAGSHDLFSWQIGAVLRPVTPVSLYAGYARGKNLIIQTEAGNLSANFNLRAPPEPESSSQIEAGVKLRSADGKIAANIAVFETRRDNFFVTLIAGADPVQVGRQKSRGIEADLTAQPINGLTLTGNVAYVDARNLSSALASVTGIATNVSTFGKRLGSTPEWSGQLWANYVVPAGVLKGVSGGFGVTYKGASYADALELLRVPAYTVLRAALGYRTERFDIQATVANLANVRYYTVPTFIGAQPGEPRSLQLTVRTHF